jgi:hypothetical protein
MKTQEGMRVIYDVANKAIDFYVNFLENKEFKRKLHITTEYMYNNPHPQLTMKMAQEDPENARLAITKAMENLDAADTWFKAWRILAEDQAETLE